MYIYTYMHVYVSVYVHIVILSIVYSCRTIGLRNCVTSTTLWYCIVTLQNTITNRRAHTHMYICICIYIYYSFIYSYALIYTCM